MKTAPRTYTSHNATENGSVLLAVIIVVLALSGLAVALLETGVQETRSNTAAGERSRVSYITETGINEAMASLLTGGDGNLGTLDAPVPFGGGDYVTRATDNGGTWTVLSIGSVNDTPHAIEVVLAPEDVPLFSRALFGDLDLGANGNVYTDSYDSALGTYASQAVNKHPVTGDIYANAKGDLGSNRNIILRGGVTILGNATPGPGYTVQIGGGPAYVAGSTAPAATPSLMPPIEFDPPVPNSGSFSAAGEVTINAGTYYYSDFIAKSTAKVTFKGDVIIYVDGDVNYAATVGMIVAPNSSVKFYHAGDSFQVTGGGVVNQDQDPAKFSVLTQATKVKFTGNSAFYGVVYAPQADLDPSGTTDIFGSFVARQISIVGDARFHYDEALSRTAPDSFSRLKKVSWRQISISEAIATMRSTKVAVPTN